MTETQSTSTPSIPSAQLGATAPDLTVDGLRPGVAALLVAMAQGRPIAADATTDDVELDATVPNWRMTAHGRDQVTAQLAEFYRHPGQFEQLAHWSIPGGQILEVTLNWTEDGVAHTAHQSHRLDLDDAGRISRDTIFCGGRWSADLRAEMEEAGERG
jgi:hypothetical protein